MSESILEAVRRHLVHSERIIAEQEQFIEDLQRAGIDTTDAEERLARFRQSLDALRADLEARERSGR